MEAESEDNWSDAEGLFNDALVHCLNSERPSEVGECYELLAAFLMRRGRFHEGERLQRMAAIFSNLEQPSLSEDDEDQNQQAASS